MCDTCSCGTIQKHNRGGLTKVDRPKDTPKQKSLKRVAKKRGRK